MHKRKRGQTLVEFAMVLPLLLAIIMGIIDFSYLVFGWAQTQFSARRGAEQASKLPPRSLDWQNEPCANRVWDEIQSIGSFSEATRIKEDEVSFFILEDSGSGPGDPNTRFTDITASKGPPFDWAKADIGDLVEIRIVHDLRPLTPLGEVLFGSSMTFSSASRRTIVSIESPLVTC